MKNSFDQARLSQLLKKAIGSRMQKDFADLLSEQGYLEASCPRCGATYHVTADMLK